MDHKGNALCLACKTCFTDACGLTEHQCGAFVDEFDVWTYGFHGERMATTVSRRGLRLIDLAQIRLDFAEFIPKLASVLDIPTPWPKFSNLDKPTGY